MDRDRQDLLNLLFYRGGVDNQWVRWNQASNSWERQPEDGENGIPSWVPRCTTNKFGRWIDGISAILDQSDPALSVAPRTDDDEDVAAAEVAETALPVLEAEIGWDNLRRELHNLIALTDKAAVVYYYDPDPKYGTEDLPLYQCATCAPTQPDGALCSPRRTCSRPRACAPTADRKAPSRRRWTRRRGSPWGCPLRSGSCVRRPSVRSSSRCPRARGGPMRSRCPGF